MTAYELRKDWSDWVKLGEDSYFCMGCIRMLIPFHFYPVIYDWAIFFFAEGKSSLFIGYHQAFILFDTLQGA